MKVEIADNARLYSYRMTHDHGFAPNPYFGFLTLATCKPGIRRNKNIREDSTWVAGFASKRLLREASRKEFCCPPIPQDGLIYLMMVEDIVSLGEYFDDHQFGVKKPQPSVYPNECGDNIYQKLSSDPDIYRGVGISYHSDNQGNYSKDTIDHDSGGVNTLVSKTFYYLGRECFVPDGGWASLGVNIPYGPSHYGVKSDADAIRSLIRVIEGKRFKLGCVGIPCLQDPARTQMSTTRGVCAR